jgi:hypothetical protein
VLLDPLTVAVNCWVAPVCTAADDGLIETATLIGAVTVTVADADLLLSATLVPRTVYVPAVAGAVYSPPVEMVPAVALQVTAVLVVPVSVAVNC